MENPIKVTRLTSKHSQVWLANETNITRICWIRHEQGLYPKISRTVLDYSAATLNLPTADVIKQYKEFQETQRMSMRGKYYLSLDTAPVADGSVELELVPELDILGEDAHQYTGDSHPFFEWRKKHCPSRIRFCINFCVHPSLLYAYESKRIRHMPTQLHDALKTAGYMEL